MKDQGPKKISNVNLIMASVGERPLGLADAIVSLHPDPEKISMIQRDHFVSGGSLAELSIHSSHVLSNTDSDFAEKMVKYGQALKQNFPEICALPFVMYSPKHGLTRERHALSPLIIASPCILDEPVEAKFINNSNPQRIGIAIKKHVL